MAPATHHPAPPIALASGRRHLQRARAQEDTLATRETSKVFQGLAGSVADSEGAGTRAERAGLQGAEGGNGEAGRGPFVQPARLWGRAVLRASLPASSSSRGLLGAPRALVRSRVAAGRSVGAAPRGAAGRGPGLGCSDSLRLPRLLRGGAASDSGARKQLCGKGALSLSCETEGGRGESCLSCMERVGCCRAREILEDETLSNVMHESKIVWDGCKTDW
ncbi:PREDICTED: uncharacterized protein LOC102028379 [Chinchilla lanigera]|uniref:uncharacterized protein LOC102028379 n=1 Tax=Chinchilla lanigera TaxID=34839 RepID=UPI00038ED9BE|nr:PREDICTED: uncharacterized protein LOC102028379 [Chinchilla lanigera]